jgi:superfamily II DNA or RNA helicase
MASEGGGDGAAPAGSGAGEHIPGIRERDGFRLREGQRAFLSAWAAALAAGERNALGVFVPGYGKTITALAAFVVARHLGVADRAVVFVPRGNLRDQYADGQALTALFRDLGVPPCSYCVADSDQTFLKNLDTELVITTYQYASGERGNDALLAFCRQSTALFVFDEVHHLADDGTWARAIERFPHAASVALSGTPVRSDNKTLFGVPFSEDEEGIQFYEALHEVGLRDAHAEGGILKRVDAHVVDYAIHLVNGDTGEEVQLSLSDLREMEAETRDLDVYLARRKLRFHEVYLETLLGPAFEAFERKRTELQREMIRSGRAASGPFRNHQMLVIAMSNRHAAAILDFVRRRFPRYSSARIGQDVPAGERGALLNDFREGRLDVMVQVDMIGEGTDIKPISVIVKADLVRAVSKTLQQVFRGMRYVAEWPEEQNLCDIFSADDSDVVATLRWMTEEERLGARKRKELLAREAPAGPAVGPSGWELKAVRNHDIRTHSLHAGAGTVRSSRDFHNDVPSRREPPAAAVDVNARERQLRKECARLASELSFFLAGRGQEVPVREVHARARQRLGKAQGELSIGELERKRVWLERCLQAGRLV